MAPRGSSSWRQSEWGPGCDTALIVGSQFQIGGPKIQAHRRAFGAFRAMGRVMYRHRYIARPLVTGGYNCRAITGGTAPSAHAQGVAVDVNWDTNPYRLDRLVTDMPREMIEEIEALRTDKGVVALRWGGDWDGRPETKQGNYDSMHYEIMATPDELRWGFSIPDFDPADRWSWPLLVETEKGGAVKRLQSLLNTALGDEDPITEDGFFGPRTARKLAAYQGSRALAVDAVVGLGTWTALFTAQPRHEEGMPMVHKAQLVTE